MPLLPSAPFPPFSWPRPWLSRKGLLFSGRRKLKFFAQPSHGVAVKPVMAGRGRRYDFFMTGLCRDAGSDSFIIFLLVYSQCFSFCLCFNIMCFKERIARVGRKWSLVNLDLIGQKKTLWINKNNGVKCNTLWFKFIYKL